MSTLQVDGATITALAPQIKAKKLSAVALTESFLARIHAVNPALNAYQTLTENEALNQARKLDKELRAGNWRGPLHGIPFSIKDNLATRGVKTTAGSKHLANWLPDFDATVVERLKAAGAVLLGKTNMHEWASGSTTINPYYGTTANPWDKTRIVGGSSGGSAAAVAASLCLGSIGTDNAGSVRNPAALCGVVGLKATFGRVSRYGGVLGTGGFSTDQFGPLAKTVRDCALILRPIAGHDPQDPLSSGETVPNYVSSLGKPVKGLRVGVIGGYFDDLMSREVKSVFDAALRQLKTLGMKIVEIKIPHMDLIPAVQLATSRVENVATAHEHLRNAPRDFSPALLYRHVKALMMPADVYMTAQRVRRLICDEFDAVLAKVDVIAAPTVGLPAETVEESRQGFVMVDGEKVALAEERGNRGTLCTIPFNVTGLPALSLCCGFSSNGLPIGMQIVAGAFEEGLIFQVGHAYELAAGWYLRKPAL
ncbi:MAG: aspartyl/glutamyl-tRNA amidotransferase subunit A [Deltaproteobacteria bacterium]|nr:aspartyl/glutamyl-tRNA amidotransferase subunit A [Deltaproteobacteria bacterium]